MVMSGLTALIQPSASTCDSAQHRCVRCLLALASPEAHKGRLGPLALEALGFLDFEIPQSQPWPAGASLPEVLQSRQVTYLMTTQQQLSQVVAAARHGRQAS